MRAQAAGAGRAGRGLGQRPQERLGDLRVAVPGGPVERRVAVPVLGLDGGAALGLAAGTSWVFRDESCHMNFAFAVIDTVRREQPELFDEDLSNRIYEMLEEAIDCEYRFAEDLLGQGVPGMSTADTKQYLQFVADQRLAQLGLSPFGPCAHLGLRPDWALGPFGPWARWDPVQPVS